MGIDVDYFSAASDDEAATVLDRVSGPGSQDVIVASGTKRGLFGRKRGKHAFGTDPTLVVYDTVSVQGIDPVVQLGTLEALLTGREFDDVIAEPRSGHAVALNEDGNLMVLTVTDSLRGALAGASDQALVEVAVPWSQTEEFWGEADPGELTEFLKSLAGLARRAEVDDKRLYCWVCM